MDKLIMDLQNFGRVIIKRGFAIILIVFLAIAAAWLFNQLAPLTYEAETTLMVKQSAAADTSLLTNLPQRLAASDNQQRLQTYIEILKSRAVIQQVIDKIQLETEKSPSYEEIVSRITPQPVKDTDLLKIKVQAASAAEAKVVTDAVVEAFNERLTSLAHSEKKTVREFIGERLQESKKELNSAENQLQMYQAQQEILSPGEATKAVMDKMSSIDKMAADNRVALSSAQARLRNIDQQLVEEKPGFIADSQLVNQYKGKVAELEVQLVSLKQNYTEQHPQVIAVRAAIEETKRKLNLEINTIVNEETPSGNPIHQMLLSSKLQMEAEVAAAAAKQGAIDKVLSEGEAEISTLPAKEQGLTKAMRNARVSEEIYTMLAKRYEEARINEVMQPIDVQVIDAAVQPVSPIKPNKKRNIAIGGLLGFFIALLYALVLEYKNQTIRSVEDVKRYLDLPVLGSIADFRVFTKVSRWSRFMGKAANKQQGRS